MAAYALGVNAQRADGHMVVRKFAGFAGIHSRTIYMPTDYGQVPVILDQEDYDRLLAASKRFCCTHAQALEGLLRVGEIKVRVPCRARKVMLSPIEAFRDKLIFFAPLRDDNHYRGGRP